VILVVMVSSFSPGDTSLEAIVGNRPGDNQGRPVHCAQALLHCRPTEDGRVLKVREGSRP